MLGYLMSKNRDWNSRKSNLRCHFIMELGEKLTKSNILGRACNPYGFQIHIIRAIESMGVFVVRNTEASDISSTSGPNQSRKRGRFSYCPRSNDRKVNIIYSKCKHFVCEEHRVTNTTVTCAKTCQDDSAKQLCENMIMKWRKQFCK